MGRNPKRGCLKNFGVAKQIGILCFVSRNFENPSSAVELLEKLMVIAHVIGKSENMGIKIGKSQFHSECGPFFRKHLKSATKIMKSRLNVPQISKKSPKFAAGLK